MKVFLFDYSSRHAQAIISSLKRQGCQVIVGTGSIPRYHFGVTQFVYWDGSVDSLLQLLAQHGIEIVMPISIKAFRFCSREKATLKAKGIKLLVSDHAAWLRLYNKAKTYEIAAGYGVPVPISVSITPDNYRERIAAAKLNFKLVIKGAEEGGARFVRYAHSNQECEEIFRDFIAQDAKVFEKGVIAQEYVQGTSCAYFCLADEGRILAEFGHRRIHQNPPSGGVSTCCTSFRNEQMFEQGRILVQNERYSGPCMVEFMHDHQKERFVLIEVNPKFWGSSLLSIVCGVDFPALYIRYLMGERFAKPEYQDRTLQFVVPDLARAIRHPNCFLAFLKMFLDSGIKKDISYFGVLPYVRYYAQTLLFRSTE